jgi:hypothetical protein
MLVLPARSFIALHDFNLVGAVLASRERQVRGGAPGWEARWNFVVRLERWRLDRMGLGLGNGVCGIAFGLPRRVMCASGVMFLLIWRMGTQRLSVRRWVVGWLVLALMAFLGIWVTGLSLGLVLIGRVGVGVRVA